MKLQQSQCSVTKVLRYSDLVNNFLKQQHHEDTEKIEPIPMTQGGLFTDIGYSWLSNGPRLEVLSTCTGARVSAWTFGAVLRDAYTRVTCVADLPTSSPHAPLLVVGLQSGLTRGMVCVFDVRSSRVLRAVQIDRQVTSIHIVDPGCDSSLPGALRALDGILAVGTKEGQILLIDLCRQACDEAISSTDSDNIRDELTACDTIQLSLQDLPMLEKHKEMALKTGDHLCIQLNEGCTNDDFILKGPRGETRLKANIVEVKISALHFCNQLGSLLVGYNFGAFQLYNLLTIKLEYSSPVYEDCIPVSNFTVQEPCDDPRAFCYVWVMYSNIEPKIPGFPVAVMYSLAYNTKEYLEGYGPLYQDLTSCSIRFQTDLTALPGSKIHKPVGASCVSLTGYTTKGAQKNNLSLQDVPEDRLTLCVVIWTVWNAVESETYMCLFDLNQWYKEQMPSTPKSQNNDSYMVFISLTELLIPTTNSNSNLLNVKLDPRSVSQFTSAQRLEEHYFPSALAFKLVCIRESDIIWVNSQGVQRHLLSCIELAGPLCLLRPSDIFLQSISLGLTPLYTDVVYNSQTPLNLQREMILCVALEHELVSWLCCCAQEWSNGCQSSYGCTLEFLLNWAWNRANTLKANANKICEPLFDYSGMRLDTNAHIQLNHCARQIKHLASLYNHVVNNCCRFLSDEAFEEIKNQFKALKMLSVYLEVLQWLLNVGLLPECPLYMYPRPDELERISAPYPVESLARFYKDRRRDLFEIQGNDNVKDSQSCDLLFIDNLIDLECGGELLRNEWKEDGGSGLYPPPSLQALLRTYLIEDVDIVLKHCIFIYVFLDLAMTLDQSRYTPIITHLIKFPAVFELSPSIIKITQAFWQLDHGDFSTAMAQLLDPLVSNEVLQPWHHRVAVKALLAQGQHQHALLYHQVRKPPMTDIQDLFITITILIVNDLLQEAFHFQRQNRSECNEKELLHHFMEACDKTNQLVHILQQPLSDAEEQAFIKYLQENRREDTENYLVLYYLQRSRFAEAFENNDKLNASSSNGKQGLIGQQQLNSRNSLVRQYKSSLPFVTQELLNYFSTQKPIAWHSVERPSPMSVFVHHNEDKMKYKSTLIQASLQKARETWTRSNKTSSEIPFVSTPKIIEPRKPYSTSIIYPEIVYSKVVPELDEEGPTPNKRRRVNSRQPISPDNKLKNSSAKSSMLLSTPIVKRKAIRSRSVASSIMLEPFGVGSPQSILKVRKLVRKSASPIERGESTTPEIVDQNSDDELQPIDVSATKIISSVINLATYSITPGKKPLGVTPRKSIQRTPRQSVHFEDRSRSSSVEKMEVDIEPSELQPDSKNSSCSVEDRFYSPDSTLENKSGQESAVSSPVKEIPVIVEAVASPRSTRKRKISDSSVKSRRSYKPELSELDNTTLNFSKVASSTLEESKLEVTIDSTKLDTELDSSRYEESGIAKIEESVIILEVEPVVEAPKKTFPKVSGRKSLTRQVLEHNTIAKALSTPRMQTRLSISKSTSSPVQKNAIGIETSHSKTVTSTVSKIGGRIVEDSSSTSVLESKNIYTTKTNPITSEQTIKHLHNESLTKSTKKLTEVLDESDSSDLSNVDPILTATSDVDDSFLVKFVPNTPLNSNDSIFSDSIDKNIDEFEEGQEEIEELEEIKEIKPEENDKKDESLETTMKIEGKKEKRAESEIFEITDDLSDEDVSFTIHSTMDVELVEPVQTLSDIVEMKDLEPECYEESDIEEEVRNVLSEDSNVDEHILNIEYAEKSTEESDEKQSSSSEDEESVKESIQTKSSEESCDSKSQDTKDSAQTEASTEEQASDEEKPEEVQFDQEKRGEEQVSDEEKQGEEESENEETQGEESSEEREDNNQNIVESDVSDSEKQSDQSESENELKVIEISSSESDIGELKIEQDGSESEETNAETNSDSNQEKESQISSQSSTSVNVFEANIVETSSDKEKSESSSSDKKDDDGASDTSTIPYVPKDQEMETEMEVETEVEVEAEVEVETASETKRSTRASSLAPATSTVEVKRKTRGRSVDPEVLRELDAKKLSKQFEVIEEELKKMEEEPVGTEQVDKTEEKAIDDQKEVSKPAKRGRKPSVQSDSVAPETENEPRVTRKGRSASVQPEDIEEKKPARRGRKPSTQPDDSEPKPESPLPKQGRKLIQLDDESKSKVEQSENVENPDSVPVRRTRKASEQPEEAKPEPVRRGRRLSEQSETGTGSGKRGRKPSEQSEVSETKPEPQRRGRKPSVQEEELETKTESPLPAKRGRKPSVQAEESASPVPRRGRRLSTQPDEVSESGNLEGTASPVLRRGRHQSIQAEEITEPTTPRRSRRTSVEPESKLEVATPTRRGRRASVQSVDQEEATTPVRRGRKPSTQSETQEEAPVRTRRASVMSEDEVKTPRKGRRTSVDSESVTSRQSALEKIEEYAATHRLTRRQKVIMEKNIEIQERKDSDRKRGPNLGEIDPINLMDKETFEGEPDPEEHRAHSPASSVCTESSVGTRSSARLQNKHPSPEMPSSSPSLPGTTVRKRVTTPGKLLDSPEKDDSEEGSTRSKRRSFTLAQQAMASPGVRKKRRLSKESDTSEAASITSAVSVRLERIETKEVDNLRHRSLSPTLLKQDAEIDSVPKVKRKGKLSILPKIELSKITEESTSSANVDTSKESEPTKTPGKVGRPRKNPAKK